MILMGTPIVVYIGTLQGFPFQSNVHLSLSKATFYDTVALGKFLAVDNMIKRKCVWLVGVIFAVQMGISRSLSLSLFSDLAALALVFTVCLSRLLLGRNLVVELLECWGC